MPYSQGPSGVGYINYTYNPPGQGSQQQTQTVYQHPIVHGGYDPDGLMGLFQEDEIDWDAFEWDVWSWVVVPGEDWEEGQGYEVGTVADGAEINFDYYRNDPLYQMAFANLDFDAESLLDLTVEDLQEATQHIVETFRGVRDGKYREPWKKDMPEPYKPTTLKTDYKTPFDIPGIVTALPSPQMGDDLKALAGRAGAANFEMHEKLLAATKPQQGYQQPKDPNWTSDSWRPAGHPDHDQERTGIGGQYVMDQYKAGKTFRQIEREAKSKGWTIGPHAQALFDGEVDIK